MIDTIALTLKAGHFHIMWPQLFVPHAGSLLANFNAGKESVVQNATKADYIAGKYKPKLTLTRRGSKITLRVECSVPKLVYGNNFDELCDADLPLVVTRLVAILDEMGVTVSRYDLLSCDVSAIHYSKNCVLEEHTSCSMVLSEIDKYSEKGRLDKSQKEYRNDGSLLRYHANSHEFVIYDKVADLKQAKLSEKRAIEKENLLQISLLDILEKEIGRSVLRLELRLNNRAKMRQMLQRLNLNSEDMTLKRLFSADLAKTMLTSFWKDTTKHIPNYVIGAADDPIKTCEKLRSANPNMQAQRFLAAFASVWLIHQCGMDKARSMLNLSGAKGSRAWSQLKQIVAQLTPPSSRYFYPTKAVDEQLKSFNALRLEDFRNKYYSQL